MRNFMLFGRSRFGVLLAASACFVVVPAAAQSKASAPLSQSLTGEAKSAYESAKLLVDDNDYAGALAKFKRAYEVSKDARLLWNMAVCEKEQRHYARAASLVSQYLKDGGKAITAEQRKNALATQTALRAFYSAVKLSGAPDGATVSVDGVAEGQTPLSEPLLLDLGTRVLRIELSGYDPFEKNVDVPGNNAFEVAVTLQHASAPVPAAPRLSVSSAGEKDIIAVDGKVLGSGHWEGIVAAGEHTVRVTAPHKKTYESHIQLAAGSSRTLDVSLENEVASGSSGVWYWVAGGAVVVAGAAVGGYFLLKPKDEPGSHPDGKLTTVFLPLMGGFR